MNLTVPDGGQGHTLLPLLLTRLKWLRLALAEQLMGRVAPQEDRAGEELFVAQWCGQRTQLLRAGSVTRSFCPYDSWGWITASPVLGGPLVLWCGVGADWQARSL